MFKFGICALVLMPMLLLAACDGNPCTNYTCNNGGTCAYDEAPKCTDNEEFYRKQYLDCWRPAKLDCGSGDYDICMRLCLLDMTCTGKLYINSDDVEWINPTYIPKPYCICTEGFTGNTCESAVADASDATDMDTEADTAVGDEGGPTDTNVGDQTGPTDTNVGDNVEPADVPSPDVPALPTWVEACTAWNTAIAERTVACLKANPDYVAGRPGALDCTTLKADIDAGLTTFDATKANACTADMQALPCSGLVSTTSIGHFEFPVPGTDCEGVLVGTGVSTVGPTTGTECGRSTQCASGYCTTRTLPGQCPGVCEDRQADGVECAFPQQCAAGLTCASGTCRAAGTTGTSCYMDERCAADMRCLNSTCQPMLGAGQSCTYDLQCAAEYRCFGGTCQALVGLNGACTEAATLSLPTVCGQGYWCNAGTCAAYPTVGQSCATTPGCTGGYCDYTNNSGTCTAYLANGANCTSKEQCASQVAAAGVCVPYGDFYCAL